MRQWVWSAIQLRTRQARPWPVLCSGLRMASRLPYIASSMTYQCPHCLSSRYSEIKYITRCFYASSIITHSHTHTQGEITIDGNFEGGMSVITRENPKGQRFDNLGGFFGGFGPQMRAFLVAIATGSREISSCSEALREVLVARAIEKSIESRQWEKVDVENLRHFERNYNR